MLEPRKYFLIIQPMDKPDSILVKSITVSNIQEILNKLSSNPDQKLLHYFRENIMDGKDEAYAYQISSGIHQQHMDEAKDFVDTDWEAELGDDMIAELEAELVMSS